MTATTFPPLSLPLAAGLIIVGLAGLGIGIRVVMWAVGWSSWLDRT